MNEQPELEFGDDAETQLEVDTLILDYLIYNAILSALAQEPRDGASPSGNSEPVATPNNHVQMVDSFLTVFKTAHPDVQVPASISFRLKLLQFVTLFNSRKQLTPITPPKSAIKQLRRENLDRAVRWHEQVGHHLNDESSSDILTSSGDAQFFAVDGEHEKLTLLDLVPGFIDLTVVRAKLANEEGDSSQSEDEDGMEVDEDDHDESEQDMTWATSPAWLSLTTDLMACAVNSLMFSEVDEQRRRRATVEAFSWGPLPRTTSAEGGDDNEQAKQDATQNAIFLLPGEDQQPELADWWRLRSERLADIESHKDSTDETALEKTMAGFLGSLADSVERPVLSQLEGEGVMTVDGVALSEREVDGLRRLARQR